MKHRDAFFVPTPGVRRCLNLGCGAHAKASTKTEVWCNLDYQPLPGVDVVRDLRRGLPFGDECIDHVLLDNVLEHFVSEDVIFILNEISRVLVSTGTATIIVPHAQSQGAVQDPTHKSFFVPRSALYWHSALSAYGGSFVGLRGDLYPLQIETFGNMKDEAFIRFEVEKRL